MSYQVLARKYRPASFEELEGQEHVLRALVNALENNRLHHAYLFTGTRGVGKTTIARILARCLNCEQGISATPCGTCGTCLEIAEGRSVDLIEVDAASRTKVEDTRELLDNVQYMPSHNRFKVYLIDEVHMLSTHSFNALLKTLEEPPEHVKFLLATTDPKKLPVTVLSRCLQFNLKNLSPERVVSYLKQILPVENIEFEENALWLLGRAADGSMRDALSLTDQAISFGNNSVNESDVKMMLGSIDQREVYGLLDGLIANDGKAILEKIGQLAEHSPDYPGLLTEMLAVLHRIALAQAVPGGLDNSQGDKLLVQDLAKVLDPEDVQLYYQIGIVGQRDLPYAPNMRTGFEMILLRMLSFTHHEQGLEPQGEKKNLKKQPLEQLPSKPLSPEQSFSGQPTAKHTMPDSISKEVSESANTSLERLADSSSTRSDNIPPQNIPPDRSPSELSQLLSTLKTDAIEVEAMTPPMDSVAQTTESAEQKVGKPENQSDDTDIIDFGDAAPEQLSQKAAKISSKIPIAVGVNAASEPIHSTQKGASSDINEKGQAATSLSRKTEQLEEKPPEVKPDPSPISIQTRIKHDQAHPDSGEALALESRHWVDILAKLGLSGVTQSVASNCCMTDSSDNGCKLLLDRSHASLWNKNHETRIQAALTKYYQRPIALTFEVGQSEGETPAQIEAQRREAARIEAVKIIEDDANVQKLIESFSGTLDLDTITARQGKNGT